MKREAEENPLVVFNERVKLLAGFFNAVGIGLIGFAVLRPLTEDMTRLSLATLWWALAGVALHVMAHYFLGHMKQEHGE